MKIIIVYATHHGSTETVANLIAKQLSRHEVKCFNLKKTKKIDLTNADIVLLGSSIHAGSNQRSMRGFIAKHMTELLQKRIGFFLCCMRQDELEQQMNNAYPEILRNRAFVYHWVGGEYKIDRMNFIEKFLLKKIAGVTDSQSHLNEENIAKLIQKINEQVL